MPINISQPVLERDDAGNYRVSALIENQLLWFESAMPLQASAEALAGLMLIPALEGGESIESEQALDSVWQSNALELAGIFSGWWKYKRQRDLLLTESCDYSSVSGSSGVGLCFTGGVDSFYSLMHEADDVSHLIFAHGYDIPLSDVQRFEKFSTTFVEIAQAFGKVPVIIRTNLREHPVFNGVSWEKTHGAAVAALGHLLGNEIGRLKVASSWAKAELSQLWGSSWETDHLWSSARMTVMHGEAKLSRLRKTALIADNSYVQRYLRVCWENRGSDLNCSHCDKCIRTMVALDVYGQLEKFTCFESDIELDREVATIPKVHPGFLADWEECAELTTKPKLRAEIQNLVQRCEKLPRGRAYKFFRRLKRWIGY